MDIIVLLDSINLLMIVKVMLVILLGVYAIFAMLMMRQISAMTRAVTMHDDYIIRGLGILHFGFALAVFVIALFAGTQ